MAMNRRWQMVSANTWARRLFLTLSRLRRAGREGRRERKKRGREETIGKQSKADFIETLGQKKRV